MKKILTFAIVAVMAISAFTACGKKEENTPDAPQSAYKVSDILDAVEKVAPVANAADVNEDYLTWLGIKPAYYTDYAGKYCSITPGVDIVLVIEAEKGYESDIKSALEARKTAIVADNENYDEFLAEKANNGRIYVKSNYVVFVIAGDGETVEDMMTIYNYIDDAVNGSF